MDKDLINNINKENKAQLKMTKDMKKGNLKRHNNEIKKLKKQIKTYKLLKRQVRLQYRISTGKRWF